MLYNSIYMKCPGQADLEDPWSRGEEKWRRLRLTANSFRASLQDNEKSSQIDCDDVTQPINPVKAHQMSTLNGELHFMSIVPQYIHC